MVIWTLGPAALGGGRRLVDCWWCSHVCGAVSVPVCAVHACSRTCRACVQPCVRSCVPCMRCGSVHACSRACRALMRACGACTRAGRASTRRAFVLIKEASSPLS